MPALGLAATPNISCGTLEGAKIKNRLKPTAAAIMVVNRV